MRSLSRLAEALMDGKVIVVTGALGALGRVVVDEALARGARIASVDHAPTGSALGSITARRFHEGCQRR